MSIRVSFNMPAVCQKCGNLEYGSVFPTEHPDGFYEKQFGHGFNRMAKLCSIYNLIWNQMGKPPFLLARDIEPHLRQALLLLSGLEKECKTLEVPDAGITYYNFTSIISGFLGHCITSPYSIITVCK